MAGPRLNAESAAPSGVGRWRDGAGLGQQEQVPQHRDDQGPLLHRGLNQPAQVLPQLTTDGLQRDRIRDPEPSTTWRNEGQQRDNQLGRGQLRTLLFMACLWGQPGAEPSACDHWHQASRGPLRALPSRKGSEAWQGHPKAQSQGPGPGRWPGPLTRQSTPDPHAQLQTPPRSDVLTC